METERHLPRCLNSTPEIEAIVMDVRSEGCAEGCAEGRAEGHMSL